MDGVGAYLIAKMRDHVIVRLSGEGIDIMCYAYNKYKSFVTFETGKGVVHNNPEGSIQVHEICPPQVSDFQRVFRRRQAQTKKI